MRSGLGLRLGLLTNPNPNPQHKEKPWERGCPLEVTAYAESATVPADHGTRAAIAVDTDADIPDIQVHGIHN